MSPNTDDLTDYMNSFKSRPAAAPPPNADSNGGEASDDLDTYMNSFKSKPLAASSDARAQAVRNGAQKLGIDPLDYATAMSYETAGTFDPYKAGPITKWGQHRGTIQYGEPQAKQYGVHPGQTFEDQVENSNVNYLRDRGVKPGADLLTIYKAINGGSVNVSENARDKNGSIREHVDRMMREHRGNAMKLLGETASSDLDDYLNSFKTNGSRNTDTQPLPVDDQSDLDAYSNSFKQSSATPGLNPDVQTLANGSQQQLQPVNQTTPVTQTVRTPVSSPAIQPYPAAPVITAPPDPTREEADPRLPQSVLQNVAPPPSPVSRFGNQTVKQLRPKVQNAALADSQITPEQRAAAEAELAQSNQAYNVLNPNAQLTAAAANNPITVNQGAQSNLGSAVQVDISKVGLSGDALKEYVYRRGLEQIAPNYNLSPGEIDQFVEEGRKGGFFNDAQFNNDLKAARAKGGDLKSHIVIPAAQIKEVLDARKANERIANEQAARREVDAQTQANANSFGGQVMQGLNQGLEVGYNAVTKPFTALRDAVTGNTPQIETPEEAAAKQQQSIYGNSSALDGQAAQYLKNQEEARNMGNIEYGANIASSAAQVPADLFSSTVLTPAAIAQTAIERAAGRDTIVGDTFLGQASEALKKTYADNFKVHQGVQSDLAVSGVRKLGNLAGTLAIGLLPGGQALTSAAFGSQTATSFYEDAKRYGASEDVRLVSAGLGAVLGTAQGSVFSKMFGGLSTQAKSSFIKEFAESIRAAVGKESANGLIKAASTAAESVAPSALGNVAKSALEGAGAMGGLTMAQNLTAQNLYDPNRKATEGVGESALEGAVIGGGLTALSHGGQAVNELRNSEPVKRAVDGVADIYKQTRIRPNLENLQDKLADIYDRADAANATVPADKIVSELTPELNKLPKKVRTEIVESIKAADAEAQQTTSKPVLGLPEQSTGNATNIAQTPSQNLEAAAEQSRPVTETPQTLAKQTEAVSNPDSAKVAALFTDPATAPILPERGQWRIRLADNSLLAVSKEKAQDYGINSFEDLERAVRHDEQGTVSALLGKPASSYSSDNPAVITTDKNGHELSATNVSNPAEASQAFAKDLADYPNDAAEQKIVSTNDVVANRQAGNSYQTAPPVIESAGGKIQVRQGDAVIQSFPDNEKGMERANRFKGQLEIANNVRANRQTAQTSDLVKTSNNIPENNQNPVTAQNSALQSNKKSEPLQQLGEKNLSETGLLSNDHQTKIVQTERGTRAQVAPKVIDSSDLITSFDADYPHHLQPRDRSRAASKAQISEIASNLNRNSSTIRPKPLTADRWWFPSKFAAKQNTP